MNRCTWFGPWRTMGAPLLALAFTLTAPLAAAAQTLVKLKAGMVTGIDQVGLPIALERGFFEKHGLDVTVARPYATGVDALNALQAGESEIVQVGVPMIGAVLRGMDLEQPFWGVRTIRGPSASAPTVRASRRRTKDTARCAPSIPQRGSSSGNTK